MFHYDNRRAEGQEVPGTGRVMVPGNISNKEAMKSVLDEQESAIEKRNKEREEMLNAKSITERVDWSVATLYRRADYIRSKETAALEGGISEARRSKNDGNVSTGNTGKGSSKESGTPKGGGRVLGEAESGTGLYGTGRRGVISFG